MERFSENGLAAVGSPPATLLNLFQNLSTPYSRARIYDCLVGAGAATADATTTLNAARTTAQGTANATFTPINLDYAGPAGQCSSGQGLFSGEPTYTSGKILLALACHQRNTVRWVCPEGSELIIAATQNYGVGLKSTAGTSTATYLCTFLHKE